MKITFSNVARGSDLILHEPSPFLAYTRAITTVTLADNAELHLGRPLFRAKGVVDANWTPITNANATASLVVANEVAFFYADELGQVKTLVADGGRDYEALSLVRGNLILKDKAIKDSVTATGGAALTDAQFTALKELAALQGIIIEKVLG